MTPPRTRSIAIVGLLVVGLLPALARADAPAAEPASATSPRGTSALGTTRTADALERATDRASGHRYSDPKYYPLRSSAYISCARSNCVVDGEPYHGGWEQDWSGDYERPWDDPDQPGAEDPFPVYAAGAGRVSIDRNVEACSSTATETDFGTIVSIDHGGGVFSVYKHLDIEVADGAWVTPTTRIGTMASWGSRPCRVAYVHMEVHRGGREGRLQPMNNLLACLEGDVKVWPDDLTPVYDDPDIPGTPTAYETWDDTTPYFTTPEIGRDPYKVPKGDDSCIPMTNATPDEPAAPRGKYGATSITVNWTAPVTPVRETVLRLEILRPSTGAWDILDYDYVGAQVTTFTYEDLDVGRDYRVQIAFRNSAGSSEWSDPVELTPGSPPDAPVAPKKLTAGATSVTYAWNRPTLNGYPVLGFVVSIRSMRRGEWGDWVSEDLPLETIYKKWTGLRSNTDHQVRVRARSVAGPSDWSRYSVITTLK